MRFWKSIFKCTFSLSLLFFSSSLFSFFKPYVFFLCYAAARSPWTKSAAHKAACTRAAPVASIRSSSAARARRVPVARVQLHSSLPVAAAAAAATRENKGDAMEYFHSFVLACCLLIALLSMVFF